MDEKIKTPPPPISMMEKMARFRCSASTSLNWGRARRGASISHFVLSNIVGYGVLASQQVFNSKG